MLEVILGTKTVHRPPLEPRRVVDHLLDGMGDVYRVEGLGEGMPPVNEGYEGEHVRSIGEPVEETVFRAKELG